MFCFTCITEGIFQGREADHLRDSDAGVDGEEAAAHQGGGGGRRQRHSRRIRLRHALRRDGQGVRRKLRYPIIDVSDPRCCSRSPGPNDFHARSEFLTSRIRNKELLF